MAVVLTIREESWRTNVTRAAYRHFGTVGPQLFVEFYALAEARLHDRLLLPFSDGFPAGNYWLWGLSYLRESGLWYIGLTKVRDLPISILASTTEGFWDIWFENKSYHVRLDGVDFETPPVLADLEPGDFISELVRRIMVAVTTARAVDLRSPVPQGRN